MSQAQHLQLQIAGQPVEEGNPPEPTNIENQPMFSGLSDYFWWLKMSVYVIFLLAGQTAATILGRLYFDKGGQSKWMATFVQSAGFPLILVSYLLSPLKNSDPNRTNTHSVTLPRLALVYVLFGVFLAANCLLYSLGLLYLPVSTYTVICASQLGFNALFSFFLNSQKLTACIINSVVLLTLSSILLVFEDDSTESKKITKGKYVIGFICTVGASAGYGLMLASTQFCFRKVLKQQTFKVVLDMIFYPSFVATLVVIIGLFASGEWKLLHRDMEDFPLGKTSYLMTLIWTAISWQVFNIGCVGLIFEVSSLFSNIISTFGLPIVPVLAVFVFHDKMNSMKVISLVLAIWGFVSYGYQHYLDGYKSNITAHVSQEVSEEVNLMMSTKVGDSTK